MLGVPSLKERTRWMDMIASAAKGLSAETIVHESKGRVRQTVPLQVTGPGTMGNEKDAVTVTTTSTNASARSLAEGISSRKLPSTPIENDAKLAAALRESLQYIAEMQGGPELQKVLKADDLKSSDRTSVKKEQIQEIQLELQRLEKHNHAPNRIGQVSRRRPSTRKAPAPPISPSKMQMQQVEQVRKKATGNISKRMAWGTPNIDHKKARLIATRRYEKARRHKAKITQQQRRPDFRHHAVGAVRAGGKFCRGSSVLVITTQPPGHNHTGRSGTYSVGNTKEALNRKIRSRLDNRHAKSASPPKATKRPAVNSPGGGIGMGVETLITRNHGSWKEEQRLDRLDGKKESSKGENSLEQEKNRQELIKEIFEELDRNGDGNVNKRELILSLRKARSNRLRKLLGIEGEEEMKQESSVREATELLFQNIDADDSREISWSEFQRYFMKKGFQNAGKTSGEEEPVMQDVRSTEESQEAQGGVLELLEGQELGHIFPALRAAGYGSNIASLSRAKLSDLSIAGISISDSHKLVEAIKHAKFFNPDVLAIEDVSEIKRRKGSRKAPKPPMRAPGGHVDLD